MAQRRGKGKHRAGATKMANSKAIGVILILVATLVLPASGMLVGMLQSLEMMVFCGAVTSFGAGILVGRLHKRFLQRDVNRARLARECRTLDMREEQAMAEEGYGTREV